MSRDDLLHKRKLEITDIADERIILTGNRSSGIHDSTGLIQFILYILNIRLVSFLRSPPARHPRYLGIIGDISAKTGSQQRVSPHFCDLSAGRIGAEGGRKRA